MHNHARLRKSKADEDAHRVQRDHAVGVRAKHNDDDDSQHREPDYPVRKGELVAPVHELTRHQSVSSEDRRETGEVGETGIRGKDQDGHGGDLQREVEDAAIAVDGSSNLAQHCVLGYGAHVHHLREMRHAEQEKAEDGGHHPQSDGGIATFRRLERGYAVRDGLRPCHSTTATRKRSKNQEQRQWGLLLKDARVDHWM